jgi:spore coat polysaccharide biosynthesis predicted glycosyltransferase SpsG
MAPWWIRADASAPVGLGHVMRCVAIAEEVASRGIEVRFVVAAPHDVAVGILARRGFASMTIPEPHDAGWLHALGAGDVVVFDGYHFSTADWSAAQALGATVVVIDDTGITDGDVDVIVNPDGLAAEPPRSTVRVLAGPRYALVRREFVARRHERGAAKEPLVLTFGGSDPYGALTTVLELLGTARPFERTLAVVGPAATIGALPNDVERVVDPGRLADVFDGAGVVVSAAGTTAWELLCMGVPTGLVQVADNQAMVARRAAEHGAALSLGGVADLPRTLLPALDQLGAESARRRLSVRALDLVDGLGTQRVVDAVLAI